MKLNKFVSVMIFASTMGMSTMSVCAAETTTAQAQELPLLNLDLAVDAAISASGKIPVIEKQIDACSEKIKDVVNTNSLEYESLYISKEQYARNILQLKESLKYQVTKSYYEIALLRKQIAFQDVKIAFNEKCLKESEVKYKQGMISKVDYESAQNTAETAKKEKTKLEADMNDKIVDFKLLTNYDISLYSLKDNEEVEYYEYPGNIQRYFEDAADDLFKYDLQLAELQKDYAYGDATMGNTFLYSAYVSNKANAASALNTVEQQKKAKIGSWTATYTSMLRTEQEIKQTEMTIADKQKSLETLKVKAEKGYVSALAVEKAEMEIEELKMGLTANKVAYNAMKEVMKNPRVTG